MFETALWEHGMPAVQWSVVLTATVVAAVTDLQSRRIPNVLTFPLLLTGPIWAGFVAGGWGVLDSIVACLVLGVPFVVLFLMAGGGAGDAKLMGAIGAWLGLGQGAIVLGAVAVCGILLAVSAAVYARQTAMVVRNLKAMTLGVVLVAMRVGKLSYIGNVQDARDMQKIPYGLAICAGTVLAGAGVLLWQ